jgi:hypothetical protein
MLFAVLVAMLVAMLVAGKSSPCLAYANRLPSFAFLYFVTSLRPYLLFSTHAYGWALLLQKERYNSLAIPQFSGLPFGGALCRSN